MITITPPVIARPFGARRQAIVSFGDTHMVIGSPRLTDTVTGLSQPSDLLLATLATDCTFACQDAAQALNIPLNSLTTSARWHTSDTGEKSIIVRLGLNGLPPSQIEQIIATVKTEATMVKMLGVAIQINFETVG
jgi:uncharacterized OsmC-like protein